MTVDGCVVFYWEEEEEYAFVPEERSNIWAFQVEINYPHKEIRRSIKKGVDYVIQNKESYKPDKPEIERPKSWGDW